jgi:hypothetical protein
MIDKDDECFFAWQGGYRDGLNVTSDVKEKMADQLYKLNRAIAALEVIAEEGNITAQMVLQEIL